MVRCSATKKGGGRCKANAMKKITKCVFHAKVYGTGTGRRSYMRTKSRR